MEGEQQTRRDVLNTYYAKIKEGKRQDEAIAETVDICDVKPSSLKRYLREEKYFEREESSGDGELADLVAAAIKSRKRTVIELADLFSVPPKAVIAAVAQLRERHIVVDNFDDELQIARQIRQETTPHRIDISKHGEREIAIGCIADSHICSKYERLDVLNALYDRFAGYGIENVYLAGNWIDGECRFNKYDIYAHGANAQVENFIKVFPARAGMKTHVLSGDDHEGWWVQREGLNIGQLMEFKANLSGRTDLVDIGYMERDIEFVQPDGSAIMRVIHPGGGSAYAHSYTLQKYVETLQGGEKPKIVVAGHFHKFNYAYAREVHCVQVGCVQDQTPFLRKKRIEAMVGGCVLWIKQAGNGVIASLKVEWLPFYDKKFYQYHW